MRIIFLLLIIIILIIIIFLQKRKFSMLYESIISSLDLELSGKDQEISPYLNSRYSVIASRLIELDRKMKFEIESERRSKEKIQAFISDLSHEIKTPLTNVIMYHEILVKKTNLDKDLKEKQERITEQLKKMEWILGSLFKSVYLEEEYLKFDLDYFEITDTISIAVSTVFKKATDKGIEISIDEFRDVCVLHNKKWTAEALINILENSIKYSPRNSKIHIHIECGEIFTEIAIRDEGIGISKDEYPFIFQRFYRSENVRDTEGSGIGLYLVKTIIEKEKGYVVVESELSKGTKISVFLQNQIENKRILTEN